mgnify:CR=1 FL=1
MKFLILNGPNINILGIREPDIYGRQTYDDLVKLIKRHAEELGVEVEFVQSNHEGDLVDAIQNRIFLPYGRLSSSTPPPTPTRASPLRTRSRVSASRQSKCISPTCRSARASVRSAIFSAAAVKTIAGQGLDGYNQALDFLTDLVRNEK